MKTSRVIIVATHGDLFTPTFQLAMFRIFVSVDFRGGGKIRIRYFFRGYFTSIILNDTGGNGYKCSISLRSLHLDL